MKRIWILNHYATDTFFAHSGRHYYFAKYLIKKGYDVTVFCASTVHNTEMNLAPGKENYREDEVDGVPYIFVKTPNYKGNGVSRIKNMVCFYFQLFPVAKKIQKKKGIPDVILASSVHPMTLLAGIQLGRSLRIPCACEIRDLWPESIVEYSQFSKNNPLICLLYHGERWLYKRADALIFTMEGGKKYIREKGWIKEIDSRKIYYINNGVDLEEFDYNQDHFQIQDRDLKDEKIFKVVYTGSIRTVNHLETLVSCAQILKNRNSNIKFLIWGDGDEKEELEEKCSKLELNNIVFKVRVDEKYIPYIVSMADVNFMHGKYTEIMRFGCSPNKLFNYLAAGKTVLTDIASSYNLIEKYRCGITVNGDMPERIAEVLLMLEREREFLQEKYGKNSRNLSIKYDFKKLTNRLENILANMEKSRK